MLRAELQKAYILIGLALCVFLAGCSTGKRVKQDIASTTTTIDQLQGKYDRQVNHQPGFVVHDKAYVGTHRIMMQENQNLPQIFSQTFMLAKPGPISLYEIASEITRITNLPVVLPKGQTAGAASGGDSQQQGRSNNMSASGGGSMEALLARPMKVSYKGPLSGFLDTVTANYNLFWEFNRKNGVVRIYRTKTKTFNLAVSVGEVKSRSNLNNESSGGGEQASGTPSKTTGYQETSLEIGLDVWQEVVENIQNMASASGRVVPNRSAGSVTVTDTPYRLAEIEDYFVDINGKFLRQVAIKVKVYALTIDDYENYGFDLNAVYTNMADNLELAISGANPITIEESGGDITATILSSPATGNKATDTTFDEDAWIGSEAVVDALAKYGDMSLITSASGITMNNQPLPLQNVKQTGYLDSVVSSDTEISSSDTLQSGKVTTGFSMLVIPNITDSGDVVMQYTLSLSSLDKMRTLSSGDKSIQAPEVSTRSFMQRVCIPVNSTLVLAGFEQTESTKNKGFGVFGGASASSHDRSLLFITISVNDINVNRLKEDV